MRTATGAYQLEVGKALEECYTSEMLHHPGVILSE